HVRVRLEAPARCEASAGARHARPGCGVASTATRRAGRSAVGVEGRSLRRPAEDSRAGVPAKGAAGARRHRRGRDAGPAQHATGARGSAAVERALMSYILKALKQAQESRSIDGTPVTAATQRMRSGERPRHIPWRWIAAGALVLNALALVLM